MNLKRIEDVLGLDTLESLQRAITAPETKWECATPTDPLAHYTGRSAHDEQAPYGSWTIQLVCLDTENMGAATSGPVVLKLTDAQAELAKKSAKAFFARHDPGDIRNGGM